MYVIGTAGHVDHGKTALVEKLTGIDTDRLPQEKQRGMTLDLGFAWLKLPNGNEISIIDVPGHERFVSNMLAGVGGIDIALLVVAADESIMPQTREHLAILDLIQVNRGVVAVTKCDLVEPDWVDMVTTDVQDALVGTTLEKASIIGVSSLTGQGLEDLVLEVQSVLDGIESTKDLGRPRLPVDRVFTVAGFGTVVTGTLVDGTLRLGQEVEMVPSAVKARIRGLQTHKQKVDAVEPGTRVAVNLAGISHDLIKRGEVLTNPAWLKASNALDVRLTVLSDSPLPIRHNMFAMVHIGTSETMARVRLLESDTIQPGDTTLAQLKLDQPLAVLKGDYFVIRSNRSTLGGGMVIDPKAKRHRRNFRPVLDGLSVMENGTDQDVLVNIISLAEPSEFSDLANRANLALDIVRKELIQLAGKSLVVLLPNTDIGPGTMIFTLDGWYGFSRAVASFLVGYHLQFPLRTGVSKEELRSRFKLEPQVFGQAVMLLHGDGVLADGGRVVRHPEHKPSLTIEQQRHVDEYIATLKANPYSSYVGQPLGDDVMGMLADGGKIVRLSDSVVFEYDVYKDIVDRIKKRITQEGQITVAEVRDLLGASRKYSIAVLEHLDQKRITQRVGDIRVLK